VEAEAQVAAALAKRQEETEAITKLRNDRFGVWLALAGVALLAGVFFYFAPPMWHALAEGFHPESHTAPFMDVVANALRGRRWYVIGAYILPIIAVVALLFTVDEVAGCGGVVGGLAVFVLIAVFPQYAALLAPFVALALVVAISYMGVQVNDLGMKIIREKDGVANSEAHLRERDQLLAASEEQLREGQNRRTAAARRAIALAEEPEQVSLPVFLSTGRRAIRAPAGR
jgi:hypothetical protein